MEKSKIRLPVLVGTMVKHIVMFKLKEKTPANLDKALAALRSLEGAIETLKFLEVGEDFNGSQRAYDLVLITHFNDKRGLELYQSHPRHQPVIQTMRELCAGSIVVDYEN